ncbi:MAG: type II toxin-antitoxin system HicA family toxin [Terriglobia bacterium]|jgi:hypothetical protein
MWKAASRDVNRYIRKLAPTEYGSHCDLEASFAQRPQSDLGPGEERLYIDRQSGSHAVFIHPDGRRTTVPIHGKRDLGRGLLRQIMKDAELTVDELLKG